MKPVGNWLASYRAKKIDRRAFSVKRSNVTTPPGYATGNETVASSYLPAPMLPSEKMPWRAIHSNDCS